MQNTIEHVFGEHRARLEEKLRESHMVSMFDSAIKTYTGTEFTGMNQRLRSKWGFIMNTLKETRSIGHMKTKKEIIELHNDTLLDTFAMMDPFVSNEHLVLYRQINDTNSKKLMEQGYLVDKGFTSATIDPFVAIRHTHAIEIAKGNPPGRTFRLHLLPNVEYKCIAIDTYSSIPDEKEILFAPNLKYYSWKQSDKDIHSLKLGSRVAYDCIVVPNEPRYTNLFEKQDWVDNWREMIMKENRMLFDNGRDTINISYDDEDDFRYYALITTLHFINEMEYIMHKHIGKIQHYDHTPVFTHLIAEMDEVIKRLDVKIDTFLEPYIARLKKIDVYQGYMFKMYGDWAAATASLHKRGGAAEVIQDLETLLQNLSQMTPPISGGVRKELRKTRQLLLKQ